MALAAGDYLPLYKKSAATKSEHEIMIKDGLAGGRGRERERVGGGGWKG